MSSRETPAIILEVKEYGEGDCLVSFLTPEEGRLTGIARHARKSRKRFAHCLEPFNRVTLFLSARPKGELEFLEKGELIRSFPRLRRDLECLGAAALMAELAGAMASPPEATGQIFAALETALTQLEEGVAPASLLPLVLFRLLTLGGYGPALEHCRLCAQEPKPPLWVSLPQGGVVCGSCAKRAPSPLVSLSPGAFRLLRAAQKLAPEKLPRLKGVPAQLRQCLTLIRLFLRYHFGQELKAWDFWDKITGRAWPPPGTSGSGSGGGDRGEGQRPLSGPLDRNK